MAAFIFCFHPKIFTFPFTHKMPDTTMQRAWPSGTIWGSLSCQRTLQHVDRSSWGLNRQPCDQWTPRFSSAGWNDLFLSRWTGTNLNPTAGVFSQSVQSHLLPLLGKRCFISTWWGRKKSWNEICILKNWRVSSACCLQWIESRTFKRKLHQSSCLRFSRRAVSLSGDSVKTSVFCL